MILRAGTSVLRTCIDMAEREFEEEDFRRFSLMSYKFGEQYHDLVAALSYLKELKVIGVDQGRLRLLGVQDSSRFKEGILSGDSLVWEVFDNVPAKYKKFNPDEAAQVLLGAQGELAVMAALKSSVAPDLHHKIRRVSLVSDHFGYDIESPSKFAERDQLSLEVKTTSRPGSLFKFFLSRNEYRTGLELENWNLVFVQLADSRFNIVGHLPHKEIQARVPKNLDSNFIWENISGTVHKNELFPGLPE
jgi:hypothetical protein